MRTSTTLRVSVAIAGALLIVTTAAPSAQRRRGNDNSSFGAPVATNTILANPDAYFGKPVTLTAGIEQVLSKTAFVVDQRKAVSATEIKAVGQPMLVIAPYLSAPLDLKHYVLMRGQVVKFDPAALARLAPDYTLDLSPELGAKYHGLPVLLASAVINSTYTDVAKKPILPPSATDVSLSAAMKIINPAFTALRTGAQESKADVVAENLAKLKPALTQTETIFGGVGQGAAATRAREAGTHVAAIERAAAAGDWEAVKTSAGALNQVCQSCHTTYRERQDDGTFRLKPGAS